MKNYLERHGTATAGEIFDDLYGQANQLATELELRFHGAKKRSGLTVPGTDISLSRSRELMEEVDGDTPCSTSRHIAAFKDAQLLDLVILREKTFATDGSASEDKILVPSEIGSYDLLPTPSIVPDYSLRIDDDGLMRCETDLLGLSRHGDDKKAALRGTSEFSPETEPEQLDEIDKKRLQVVTDAIELGIARAQLLANGADFYGLFDLPRPVRRRTFHSAFHSIARRVL